MLCSRSITWSQFNFSKCFSVLPCLQQKSHYDSLGLTPKASQADIKDAFYKLSKVYHPDKNQSDPDAADKFREIVDAYEILGNLSARKLYDRGSHQHSVRTPGQPGFKVPDDPQAAFYRSRAYKDQAVSVRASRMYNFDEWTKQHYSDNVKRRSDYLSSYKSYKIDKREEAARKDKTGYFAFGVVLVVVVAYNGLAAAKASNDTPQK